MRESGCLGLAMMLALSAQGALAGTAGPYVLTAIHCDPHMAQQSHWNALAQLVSDANERRIKLTIEMTAQWALLVRADPLKIAALQTWADQGHEIAAHHHQLGHAVWDGYSNLPQAASAPGFRGTMSSFVEAFNPPFPFPCSDTLSTPEPADWIPCAIHRTGGSFGMFIPISTPVMQTLNAQRVWQIEHAPLRTTAGWNTTTLIDAYHAALPGQIVGAAFHPHDYDTPGERTQALAWLDFIAQQDPTGSRLLAASGIIGILTQRADVSGDFVVSFADITDILTNFGSTARWFDVDGSGTVGFGDIVEVLATWPQTR